MAVADPVVISPEAYTSADYVRREAQLLWPKVWQLACRVEDIPKVGDFVTYDILDDSIIVVRTSSDRIRAFHNVCQHRGRRLTKGSGHTSQFVCRFHGWRWNLDGECSFVLDAEDWGNCLTPENTRLPGVKAELWGGFVWINMDPHSEPLEQFLGPVVRLMGPFEFDKMRYRWRQWLHFPCNWKTAVEAFIESYHVFGTHPQLTKWGEYLSTCHVEGHHAWHGFTGLRGGVAQMKAGLTGSLGGKKVGDDPRVASWEFLDTLMKTINATTTDTFVNAAKRLVDELPEGATVDEVNAHLFDSAKRDDAARGVIWPAVSPEVMEEAGFNWLVFPNTVILFGITFALCYRARPNGYDPDSCIFEVSVIERFPEGQEPETRWVHEPDPSIEKWRKVLTQDFLNMPEVQRGMKSRGFKGSRPSPIQEVAVIQLHKMLAKYMNTAEPAKL